MNLFRFEESRRVDLGIHLIPRQRNDPPLTHMIPPTERQIHNTTMWVYMSLDVVVLIEPLLVVPLLVNVVNDVAVIVGVVRDDLGQDPLLLSVLCTNPRRHLQHHMYSDTPSLWGEHVQLHRTVNLFIWTSNIQETPSTGQAVAHVCVSQPKHTLCSSIPYRGYW